MSVSGGSIRAVYVRMEKIDPGALTTNRGWTIEEDERVAALLTETWGKGWEEHGYRLAYGVVNGMLSVPRKVGWVSPVLSETYDPTLKELFMNTTKEEGEDYYLLISNLDPSRVDDHWVKEAVERFSAIYPPLAHNLREAWDVLLVYTHRNYGNLDMLKQKYPEAFATWGLITQVHDAYEQGTAQSELQKQIAEILSRADMPELFDGFYDDGDKIFLKDILLYINRELRLYLDRALRMSFPLCVEVLVKLYARLELGSYGRNIWERNLRQYREDKDSVKMMTVVAKQLNFWAKMQSFSWGVHECREKYLGSIKSPDGEVDWTRCAWLVWCELKLQQIYAFTPDILEQMEEWLREREEQVDREANNTTHEVLTRAAGKLRASSPAEQGKDKLWASSRAEKLKNKRARKRELDAGDIERIQKWPHCCTILENFMKTIVEPAWKDMEEVTHVEKWTDQVTYSKDPQNNIKEEPVNPIDAFEYWANVLMWDVYPETMENLYNEISYTPNNPSVPSPPGSTTPDWTFAVYVLRWMVVHDPMVSESVRDAYKTEQLSVGLIDDIERLYSDMDHDVNEFLREGGLRSLLVQLKQLCFDGISGF